MSNSVWDKVWENKDFVGEWDYLSQVILRILEDETSVLQGKRVLEAGSGSGRISLKLAKNGARVFLLDYSLEAVNLSRKIFQDNREKINIVCGSIFAMSYPDNYFDIVWNAGVIEHFVGEEQDDALREMVRVCKKGGLVITINPYASSLLHTFGKFIIERLVKYPFGEEVPIRTLKDKAPLFKCKLKKEEYSIGFIVLWVGMFKRLMLLPSGKIFNGIYALLNKLFCSLDVSYQGGIIRKIDLFLSKLFGGYLLVTAIKK